MIAYIDGHIKDSSANSVLVYTSAGLGFLLQVPIIRWKNIEVGAAFSAYVYSIIREPDFNLYGFPDNESKYLFEQLISVSGIGPKVALVLLSTYSNATLARSIVNRDLNALTAVPGVGKRTADRLCLDLGERLVAMIGGETADKDTNVRRDVISALENMGFPQQRIQAVMAKIDVVDQTFDDLFRDALMRLTGRMD